MKSTRIHLLSLAMVAVTTAATACDPETDPAWDEDAIDLDDAEFRCSLIGGCGGGGNLNTNHAGANPDYMFWHLPLQPGAHPTIDLDKIKTNKCYDDTGGIRLGSFVVHDPILSVDSLGDFEPFTVKDVNDPSVTCQVYGDALVYSRWFLSGQLENPAGQLDDVSIKLKITKRVIDTDGRALMEWKSDHDYLYGGGGTGNLQPTCDEAEDAEPGLEFTAMLYDELDIDEADNTFGTMTNVAFIGCLSGTVGKTGVLWDYDLTDTATHQVVTNAAMAAYCGDGHSYTQTGTKIDLWNIHGAISDPDYVAPVTGAGEDFELEAVWNADNEALCIGTTRLPQHQPDWGSGSTGFECQGAGQSWFMPECTQQHLDDPAAVLATYAYVGT